MPCKKAGKKAIIGEEFREEDEHHQKHMRQNSQRN